MYFETFRENGIKGRIRSESFLRIFTVAFILFLAPTVCSNPAGHLLTLTEPNLKTKTHTKYPKDAFNKKRYRT